MDQRFRLLICFILAIRHSGAVDGRDGARAAEANSASQTQKATRRKAEKPNKAAKPHKTAEARPRKGGAQEGQENQACRGARQVEEVRRALEAPKKPDTPPLTGDLAAVKNAIDLARKGKTEDATDAQKTIADPAGQKLAEWFMLRHPEPTRAFTRFAAFLDNNPDWPSKALMRRRAEARLWQERSRRGHHSRLLCRRPPTAQGPLCAGAGASCRRRPPRRRARGSRGLALGRTGRSNRSDGVREVPRTAGARGPSRAHGQADRRQGAFGGDARRQTAWRR